MPIQRIFNINPNSIGSIITENPNIWHIGRFAISKNEKEGAVLLKKLLTLAIYPICQDLGSIMVAECDRKFVRGLNLLGIKTEILAPGIQYLGSETLPIYSTQDWLQIYLSKSTYLKEIIDIYKKSLLYAILPQNITPSTAVAI